MLSLVDRWFFRAVIVLLLVAGIYLAAREVADWLVWRRDVSAAIQHLARQLAPPPLPPAKGTK